MFQFAKDYKVGDLSSMPYQALGFGVQQIPSTGKLLHEQVQLIHGLRFEAKENLSNNQSILAGIKANVAHSYISSNEAGYRSPIKEKKIFNYDEYMKQLEMKLKTHKERSQLGRGNTSLINSPSGPISHSPPAYGRIQSYDQSQQ